MNRLASTLRWTSICTAIAWGACDDISPNDVGSDELAVVEVGKTDHAAVCRANSDIDFERVDFDGVAASDGFDADKDVKKVIKTRVTFEKYFGTDAPEVDFGTHWIYVWTAPTSAAGDTMSIERICLSSDKKAVVIATELTTLGKGCEANDTRPQIVVSFPKPSGEVTAARAVATVVAGEACDDEHPSERSLTGHDISVLFPLPALGEDGLWKASTAGRGGAFLPKATFDEIGHSLTNALEEADEYASLRVVAVRFDPCFQIGLDATCQAQVRLVFQPFSAMPASGVAGFHDGAVHALYNIADEDFPRLVSELRALTTNAPENLASLPLGVSPALRKQGLDGAYAKGLLALVSGYAGPDTLARMTFMTRTNTRSGQWEFGGFHISNRGNPEWPSPGDITMVGADAATMQVVTLAFSLGFEYEVDPPFAEAAGRTAVDSAVLDGMDSAARKATHAWALRQEDPTVHVPDTTDCASCHVSGHIARHLEALDPALVTPALVASRGPRARVRRRRWGRQPARLRLVWRRPSRLAAHRQRDQGGAGRIPRRRMSVSLSPFHPSFGRAPMRLSSSLRLATCIATVALGLVACGDSASVDVGELAVSEAAKDDASVACKANSDIDFETVDAAPGEGFAAAGDIRKIIKTRVTFEKYFGDDAPEVDFETHWVYVWLGPVAAVGDVASIEEGLCRSSDGTAVVVSTRLTTQGAGCDATDARPQVVV